MIGQAVVLVADSFFQTSVFWLPVVLAYIFVKLYFYYIRSRFWRQVKFVLLEVRIPKEIKKTPKAMEIALNSFQQKWDGDNLLIGQWILGQSRAWFSLEIVSLGGQIHFYIWTQKFFQNLVESQIYAQYPEVEIVEVEDYANKVPYGLPGSDWKLYGAEFKLEKEDAYPIKTYIDYGLDKEGIKEEEKSDPLTATLEYLGTMGSEEQMWIQILIMAARKRFPKPGALFGKEDWKANSKKLIEKLMQRDKSKKASPEEGGIGFTVLSPGERRVIESVERNLSKPGFDCGIRAIYLAKEEKFNSLNVVGLFSIFKQYNDPDLNGFKGRWRTGLSYPWHDPFGRRVPRMKRRIFNAYRHRGYFYPPYERTPFVLSSEELATIYHFPGQVAATPTFAKIESRRGEPPVNLPV